MEHRASIHTSSNSVGIVVFDVYGLEVFAVPRCREVDEVLAGWFFSAEVHRLVTPFTSPVPLFTRNTLS